MKGLILAAGKGSRLSELKLKHKSFAVVQKKHVINFSLDLLSKINNDNRSLVSEVVIVVGHNKDVIIETLGDNYNGIPITYVEQTELKGIAHAVLTARNALNDDFVMCLADEILINPDMVGMIDYFKQTGAICVCGAIYDSTDQSGKPIAYSVDDSNNIVEVEEKPANGYPNEIRGIGEVVFRKDSLNYLDQLTPNPIRGELEMGEWIQLLSTKGEAKVFQLADAYVNINYASDIETANDLLGRSTK